MNEPVANTLGPLPVSSERAALGVTHLGHETFEIGVRTDSNTGTLLLNAGFYVVCAQDCPSPHCGLKLHARTSTGSPLGAYGNSKDSSALAEAAITRAPDKIPIRCESCREYSEVEERSLHGAGHHRQVASRQ